MFYTPYEIIQKSWLRFCVCGISVSFPTRFITGSFWRGFWSGTGENASPTNDDCRTLYLVMIEKPHRELALRKRESRGKADGGFYAWFPCPSPPAALFLFSSKKEWIFVSKCAILLMFSFFGIAGAGWAPGFYRRPICRLPEKAESALGFVSRRNPPSLQAAPAWDKRCSPCKGGVSQQTGGYLNLWKSSFTSRKTAPRYVPR